MFITPKLPVQKKNPMAEEAYEVMKSLVSKQGQRDEYHVFGKHVGYKIRKLPTDYAKSTVEYLINNILYGAKTGKYDYLPSAAVPIYSTTIQPKSVRKCTISK